MWPSVLHTKANRSLDNMKECIDGSLLLYCDTALSPPWWMIRDKRSFGIFAKEAELPTRRRNHHRRRRRHCAACTLQRAPCNTQKEPSEWVNLHFMALQAYAACSNMTFFNYLTEAAVCCRTGRRRRAAAPPYHRCCLAYCKKKNLH